MVSFSIQVNEKTNHIFPVAGYGNERTQRKSAWCCHSPSSAARDCAPSLPPVRLCHSASGKFWSLHYCTYSCLLFLQLNGLYYGMFNANPKAKVSMKVWCAYVSMLEDRGCGVSMLEDRGCGVSMLEDRGAQVHVMHEQKALTL